MGHRRVAGDKPQEVALAGPIGAKHGDALAEPDLEASGAGQGQSKAMTKAVKCDMCRDIASGPNCVRACPTGAALRISPEKFLDYAGVNQ